MTIRSRLNEAEALLLKAGVPDARLEAEWMLADALSTSRGRMRLALDEPLPPGALSVFEGWLNRRARGIPLQYVQNRAHFMGHEFFVDERVLIPRQDTEILCELAIERVGLAGEGARCLDLCTGSGALAVSIQRACPGSQVFASDVSRGALFVAEQNARALCAPVRFFEGDLLKPFEGEQFDVVVCNPPYLSDADMNCLQAEVRREPELALRGGQDGYAFYHRLARELRPCLRPGGCALFEVGVGQAETVALMMEAGLGGLTRIFPDLCGIARVVLWEAGARVEML